MGDSIALFDDIYMVQHHNSYLIHLYNINQLDNTSVLGCVMLCC